MFFFSLSVPALVPRRVYLAFFVSLGLNFDSTGWLVGKVGSALVNPPYCLFPPAMANGQRSRRAHQSMGPRAVVSQHCRRLDMPNSGLNFCQGGRKGIGNAKHTSNWVYDGWFSHCLAYCVTEMASRLFSIPSFLSRVKNSKPGWNFSAISFFISHFLTLTAIERVPKMGLFSCGLNADFSSRLRHIQMCHQREKASYHLRCNYCGRQTSWTGSGAHPAFMQHGAE